MSSTTEALIALGVWIEQNGLSDTAKTMLNGRLMEQIKGLCREFEAMEARAVRAEKELEISHETIERLSTIADKASGALDKGLALANKMASASSNPRAIAYKASGTHTARAIREKDRPIIEVCTKCEKTKCHFDKKCKNLHTEDGCKFCHCKSE